MRGRKLENKFLFFLFLEAGKKGRYNDSNTANKKNIKIQVYLNTENPKNKLVQIIS